MPNLKKLEKCQSNSMPLTLRINQPNLLCWQSCTIRDQHCSSRSHNFSLRFSLNFFFCLMVALHRNIGGGADAFLLAHRKMLLPFASARIGAVKNDVDIEADRPAKLVGFLVVPKRHSVTPGTTDLLLQNNGIEFFGSANGQQGVDDNGNQQPWNDGIIEAYKPALLDNDGSGTAEERANENGGEEETDGPADQLRMVKRMHHLSILRKIGAPGANSAASRLFGPLRQRELKRRAWMSQY